MADTKAADAKTPATADRHPSRWWQWFFLYPAFGVAVLTAVPQWATKAQEMYLDLRGTTLREAEMLNEFMRKNWECTQAPSQWIETPNQTMVDGTICESTGDIFLRIMTPGEEVFLRGIFVENLIQTAEAPGWSPVAAAQAAAPVAGPQPVSPTLRAQQLAITICQKWLDNRRIKKRVQVGGQCFDEVYDSFTGRRQSRAPAPCDANC